MKYENCVSCRFENQGNNGNDYPCDKCNGINQYGEKDTMLCPHCGQFIWID
ncbi:MAG TPA: hypothetical protein VIM42_09240 [Clostridium sp.]